MGAKEANLAAKCNIIISEHGGRVRRNNVGYDRELRMPYGLGKGSPDYVGWLPLDGRAVVLTVEYKTPGIKTTQEQRNCLEQIAKAGGIAIVGRSPEQVKSALDKVKDGSYPWGVVYE